MLIEERLREIEKCIENNKFYSINQIAETFDISKATARRDLKVLADKNLLRLTRGGAISLVVGTTHELPYTIKKGVNHKEKIRIGKRAAELVKEGETIVIDSGSTLVEMAFALKEMKNITVATNDLLIGCELATSMGIDLTMIGGNVRKNYFSMQGYFAQLAFEHINADKVFLGVDALDLTKGCMVTNMEEVVIKKAMLNTANEKIVICDHSKFTNVAFIKLCELNSIDRIITGKELDASVYNNFINEGISIELA